ncbi:MAG: alpha/beta hydrolase [Planctomycetota bacterium]
MSANVHLEPEAQEFAKATANPPFLADLGPKKGRATVDEVQSGPIAKPELDVVDLMVPGGPTGQVSVRVLRPSASPSPLPVILYIHGAGWVFGNAHTHDRLVRELAVGAKAAVVFPNYSLSPEAKYPTSIEECYAVLQWIENQAWEQGFEPTQIAVAGDSVGGNMAIAMTLMSRERQGPKISQQLLFYPVTDASFETESYQQFATGFFLRRDAMQWFWDQYLPDLERRKELTASPLKATTEQLRGLPRALVITAEADVLRDEGEAYANALRKAGVPVTAARFQGIIHDFVMLNALAKTNAARGAMDLAMSWLRDGFSQSR